jgi:hypothetical protein
MMLNAAMLGSTGYCKPHRFLISVLGQHLQGCMFRLELLQLQPVLCSLQAKHEAAPKADAEAAEHIRMLVRKCLGSLSGSSARRSWACIATGMFSTHDADAAIHVATVLVIELETVSAPMAITGM